MLPGSTWRKPDAAADRRGDAGVGELQLRAVDLALVDLHRAFVLAHERRLRVDLLLRDRVLLEQRAVALEVELRVLEQRVVARQLSLGLRELHLERARIDLGEQLAFLDDLALLEQHPHELPVDAAAHRDGPQRRDRAERIEIDVDVGRARRRRDHRCPRRTAGTARPAGGGRRRGIGHGRELPVGEVPADREQDDHERPEPGAASRTVCGRRRLVVQRGFGRAVHGKGGKRPDARLQQKAPREPVSGRRPIVAKHCPAPDARTAR